MSTHDINGRPTNPDTHTRPVREHVARIFPDSATAAHHAADTDDETLKARAVRDIREAMRPADADAGEDADPPSERPKWNPIAVLPAVVVAGEMFAEARAEVTRPHVATLPDGRTVSLPAGTVLREDDRRDALTVLAEFEREAKAAAGHAQRVLAAETRNVNKLLNVASQAIDMLRRARPWIAPTVPEGLTGPQPQPAATVAPLRAEIDAFLAGEFTPDRTDERARALAAFRTYLDEYGLGKYDPEKAEEAEAVFLQGLP